MKLIDLEYSMLECNNQSRITKSALLFDSNSKYVFSRAIEHFKKDSLLDFLENFMGLPTIFKKLIFVNRTGGSKRRNERR